MPFQDSTNLYSISKYIVDANGDTPYTTIQSALDAANAAGVPDTVYVRPGGYTENLTLYSDISIYSLCDQLAVIDGQHTPPASGVIQLKNLALGGDPDILNSAAAGTAFIEFIGCDLGPGGGYIFNLPNWTGNLSIRNCVNTFGPIDGVINNTAGSSLSITNSYIGGGTLLTMTMTGNLAVVGSEINSPIDFQTGSLVIVNASSFEQTVTFSNNSTALMFDCGFLKTGASAIIHNSSGKIELSSCTIDCDTSPAIAGSGAGNLEIGSVTYLDNADVAGTLTIGTDSKFQCREIKADNITDLTFSGFLEWDAAGPFYSVAGSTVTILVAGSGYIKSEKVSWTAPQNTGALAAGSTYYIYMDSTGTIGSTSTRSTALFQDNIVLLEALVDSSGVPNVIVVNESHPYTFPVETSEWAHDTIGAVIANKSNGANITLNGTKAIQINGADELEDHGLETTIPDSGGAAVTFSFMYTNVGGKWVRNSTGTLFPSDYNNAGVVTALGANKYGIFRLFVSKDSLNASTPTYYAVYDDQEYNNLTAANTAIALNTPAGISAELAQLELAQLGFVVKEESSDTIVNVVIEKSTARSGTSGAVPNQSSLVTTDTTNFNGFLSVADTNVQAALDTLDDFGVMTNGQLLIGSTGAAPAQATLASADSSMTITNGAGTIDLSSKIVQVVHANTTSTVSTGANIPADNTIPQNTEGAELLTATITPKNSSNSLIILFTGDISLSARLGQIATLALFQDSTANAEQSVQFARMSNVGTASSWGGTPVLRYETAAGTTSATTFKIRGGTDAGFSATLTMNSNGYGGTNSSSITIMEIKT